MANKIVIIGNGIAAVSALKAIRSVDKVSEVFVFGEENLYPYNRIRLSKSLFDEIKEESMLLMKKDWYEENKINIFLNSKVVKLNVENKEIILFDGRVFKYDKLLLANGARNIEPNIEEIKKNGVFALRTLQDAIEVRSKIEKGEEVINIGGGIQGLETAWNLHQYGAKTSIIELQSRIMPNQLDEKASEIIRQAIEKFGIRIHLNTRIDKVIGDDKVEGLMTASKRILNCDKVIYAAGIKPNIEILKDTQIEFHKGIIVNEKMETNLEDIYAAGDVAEFHSLVSGLWNIAIEQGKVAGHNMSGQTITYKNIVPTITLNAFKISLFSMGCVDERKSSNVVIQDDTEGQYIKVYIRDNNIIGAIVIGDTKRSPIFKSAIEKKIALNGIDLSKVSVDELLDKIQNK